MILWVTQVPPEEDRASAIVAIRDVLTLLGADDRIAAAREVYRQVVGGVSAMLGTVEHASVADNALARLREGRCDGAILPADTASPPTTLEEIVAPEPEAKFEPSYQTSQAALVLLMAVNGKIGDALAITKLLADALDEPHKSFWVDVGTTYIDAVPLVIVGG